MGSYVDAFKKQIEENNKKQKLFEILLTRINRNAASELEIDIAECLSLLVGIHQVSNDTINKEFKDLESSLTELNKVFPGKK